MELKIAPEKPKELEEMLAICQKISKDFLFVRIDFLQCKKGVILGELTFSPSSGYNTKFTTEAQIQLGEWLDLSQSKFYKKK